MVVPVTYGHVMRVKEKQVGLFSFSVEKSKVWPPKCCEFIASWLRCAVLRALEPFPDGMDHKKNANRRHDFSPNRRNKRHSKVLEENYWDCSVCTYRNTAEAFKCLMCDVRKGTSTRKPRINPQLVAQQVAQQFNNTPPKVKKESKEKSEKKESPSERTTKKGKHPPRLKNVDRSTAQHREVTVNNVTVIITEYKPKPKKSTSDHSGQSSSVSSENGNESGTDTRNGDVGNDSRSS